MVIEGPKAGGHLGFSREELACEKELDFDSEIKRIIAVVKEYGRKFGRTIPVFVAGGIFSKEDVEHAVALGADGVQVASRFVATEECDASTAYKEAYVHAREQDVEIIDSPVGMPGRALHNAFLSEVKEHKMAVGKCYGCLAKCKPNQIPYCITDALIKAVKGDVEHGLVFCGENVGKIHDITTVHQVMEELA